MKLLKRRVREKKPAVSTGITATIARSMEGIKRKLADFLGRQSERFTIPQLKVMCLLIGLTIGSICAGLILRPLMDNKTKRFVIPEPIEAPILKLPSTTPDLVIGNYQPIIRFKRFIDSLKHSPEGRRQYEEIVKARPGLLDSVELLLSGN